MNSQINDLAPEEYALLDPVPVISSDPIQSSAQCINSKQKSNFVNNLDRNKIADLHSFILDKNLNTDTITKDDINTICGTISDIFSDSASVSMSIKINSDSNFRHKNDKPWYGHQCRNARNQYHLAKKRHNKNPTHSNKSILIEASKTYKKKMNFYISKHKKATQQKLRKMKLASFPFCLISILS